MFKKTNFEVSEERYREKNIKFFERVEKEKKAIYVEFPTEDDDTYYDLLEATDGNRIPIPIFLKIVGWDEDLSRGSVISRLREVGLEVEKRKEYFERFEWPDVHFDCHRCPHFTFEQMEFVDHKEGVIYNHLHKQRCTKEWCPGVSPRPTYRVSDQGIPVAFYDGKKLLIYKKIAQKGNLGLIKVDDRNYYLVDLEGQKVIKEFKGVTEPPSLTSLK